MDVEHCNPEAAYLTKNNIVHPGTAPVAVLEATARAELSQRKSFTVTGGSIKR